MEGPTAQVPKKPSGPRVAFKRPPPGRCSVISVRFRQISFSGRRLRRPPGCREEPSTPPQRVAATGSQHSARNKSNPEGKTFRIASNASDEIVVPHLFKCLIFFVNFPQLSSFPFLRKCLCIYTSPCAVPQYSNFLASSGKWHNLRGAFSADALQLHCGESMGG